MDFKMELRQQCGQATVLHVQGDIDVCTSPALQKQLSILIATEDPLVEVDLGGVPYLDSSGVAVLMKTKRTLDGHGRDLKLLNVLPSVRRIFSVLALERYLAS